jgi:hypothetical protein
MTGTPTGKFADFSLAKFLEDVPPSQRRTIVDLSSRQSAQHFRRMITPQLLLHCTNDFCDGPRAFRCSLDVTFNNDESPRNVFLSYVCSNCRTNLKIFSLNVAPDTNGGDGGTAYKFGEKPAFGPTTPTRLLSMLGDQKDAFLRGRRCESQGLGIGAFSYYRRVVENQKSRILDEIIKVAKKVGRNP